MKRMDLLFCLLVFFCVGDNPLLSQENASDDNAAPYYLEASKLIPGELKSQLSTEQILKAISQPGTVLKESDPRIAPRILELLAKGSAAEQVLWTIGNEDSYTKLIPHVDETRPLIDYSFYQAIKNFKEHKFQRGIDIWFDAMLLSQRLASGNARFLICFQISESHQSTGLVILENFIDDFSPSDIDYLQKKFKLLNKEKPKLQDIWEFEKQSLIKCIKDNPVDFFTVLNSMSSSLISEGGNLWGYDTKARKISKSQADKRLEQVDFDVINSHFDAILKVVQTEGSDVKNEVKAIHQSAEKLPTSFNKAIMVYCTPSILHGYESSVKLQKKYDLLEDLIEKLIENRKKS